MDKHVTIVAAFNMAIGGIMFALGLFLFVVIAGGGMFSGDPQAMFITGAVASGLGLFFTVLGVPCIIAGFGLLSHKNWARFLVIVISVLNLINVPVGTIVSLYSLWVLFNDDTIALFS